MRCSYGQVQWKKLLVTEGHNFRVIQVLVKISSAPVSFVSHTESI